jgi:hypothetical protein
MGEISPLPGIQNCSEKSGPANAWTGKPACRYRTIANQGVYAQKKSMT